MIVQVPVDAGLQLQEGVVGRAELLPRVYIAKSLVKVEKDALLLALLIPLQRK